MGLRNRAVLVMGFMGAFEEANWSPSTSTTSTTSSSTSSTSSSNAAAWS
ncbi:MAG: hypothetical protein Q8O67_23120 [Deltaproteobacteria bacterium]|nr:hypothetical protein [Deltaproteobacteria bacterium]